MQRIKSWVVCGTEREEGIFRRGSKTKIGYKGFSIVESTERPGNTLYGSLVKKSILNMVYCHDLETDPREITNLAQEDGQGERAAQLIAELKEWSQQDVVQGLRRRRQQE